MKIAFLKVLNSPTKFDFEKNGLRFVGVLNKKDATSINLKAKIFGEISHFCNHCGAEILLKIDENLDLILTDGISNMSSLDIIEILGGNIDLSEILLSEVEAYKSDYFYCEKCKNL